MDERKPENIDAEGWSDGQALVIRHLEDAIGPIVDRSIDAGLGDDLGIESVLLLTILLDIVDELQVDVALSEVDLGSLRTVGDLVALIVTLGDRPRPLLR